MSEERFKKGDWTNCRYDICEIIDEDDEVVCIVSLNDADKVIAILEENEKLKKQLEIRTASDKYHQRMLNKWLCKNE